MSTMVVCLPNLGGPTSWPLCVVSSYTVPALPWQAQGCLSACLHAPGPGTQGKNLVRQSYQTVPHTRPAVAREKRPPLVPHRFVLEASKLRETGMHGRAAFP
jgi:hypothetical protein